MTIITKSGDKKKLIPLAIPKASAQPAPSAPRDAEIADYVEHRRRTRATNFVVFMMALLVLLMGVLSGICLYRQYIRPKVQRFGFYVPYDNDVDEAQLSWANHQGLMGGRDGPTDEYKYNEHYDEEAKQIEQIHNFIRQFYERINRQLNEEFSQSDEFEKIEKLDVADKFFKEDIEMNDDENDSFTDITIPDFKDGRRSGRFLHDFVANRTTIVDMTAGRCFVYPLDRNTTFPPRSFAELMEKMTDGSFFPDTTVLKQKFRVALPALSADDDMISLRTAQACRGFRIYKLEPFVSGVFKRSVDSQLSSAGMFAEFAGNGIVNVDLLNIAEVEEFEKGLK